MERPGGGEISFYATDLGKQPVVKEPLESGIRGEGDKRGGVHIFLKFINGGSGINGVVCTIMGLKRRQILGKIRAKWN